MPKRNLYKLKGVCYVVIVMHKTFKSPRCFIN